MREEEERGSRFCRAKKLGALCKKRMGGRRGEKRKTNIDTSFTQCTKKTQHFTQRTKRRGGRRRDTTLYATHKKRRRTKRGDGKRHTTYAVPEARAQVHSRRSARDSRERSSTCTEFPRGDFLGERERQYIDIHIYLYIYLYIYISIYISMDIYIYIYIYKEKIF